MILQKKIVWIIALLVLQNFGFAQFSFTKKPLLPPLDIENNSLNSESKKFGEPDRRGLVFGFNMGMFKGNGFSALYYNGAPANENNINFIINNPYYHEEIRHKVNEHNFSLYSWPTTMSYDITILAGFYARYNVTNTLGYFMQFNIARLNTTGQFALSIDSVNFTSEPSLRYYSIYGQEQRTYIDIGVQKQWYLGEISNIFAEGGINFTSVLVKKSAISIENTEYSLVNVYGSQQYIPNSGLQPYDVRQGGVGIGFFCGGGISVYFNNNVSVEPGFNLYYQSINLTDYENYRLNYSIFVRLVLRNFL
ncbi:MAG: hypothetical protein NTZ33_10570 [Bacteroidetes bacterium]|nr:hypothetical protein [Bacteroidota bacterium]